MKAKTLSTYTAAFLITLIGAAATMLILNVANSPLVEIGYANENPETFVIPEN